jgi:hypothetical protein
MRDYLQYGNFTVYVSTSSFSCCGYHLTRHRRRVQITLIPIKEDLPVPLSTSST